jgi:hypothetical protein
MVASCPSNREAEVTILIGFFKRYGSGVFIDKIKPFGGAVKVIKTLEAYSQQFNT